MEAPVPKKLNLQDKVFPDLPALPEIFRAVLPTPVPQIDYRPGIVPLLDNFLHNWKLKQMEREAERQANIAEYKVRQGRAQSEAILQLLLFGEDYKARLKEINHRMEMMDIEEQKGRHEITKMQLENQIIYYQAQQEEIEYKLKLKNFEEMENGNGASPHQDRLE